jgi:hypothetical protein
VRAGSTRSVTAPACTADQQRFDLIFWMVALTPLVGVTLWLWLSRATLPSTRLV